MPFPSFDPSIYFDDNEIADFTAEFSERLRRDVRLRATMDKLIGNQWLEAEVAMEKFLSRTLFLDGRPSIDGDFVAKAMRLLTSAQIDALVDLVLQCALKAFTLQNAGLIVEIVEELAAIIRPVLRAEGVQRQKRLIDMQSRLSAGALLNGL